MRYVIAFIVAACTSAVAAQPLKIDAPQRVPVCKVTATKLPDGMRYSCPGWTLTVPDRYKPTAAAANSRAALERLQAQVEHGRP